MCWWICLFWIFRISQIIEYVAFGFQLISIKIIFSKFSLVLAYISTSFLFIAECILWIYYILFIHSPTNGLLAYSYLLAIMNNATMKIHVQVIIWTPVFDSFGYISGSGIAGSYNYKLNFWETAKLCFKVVAPFYIHSVMHENSNVCTFSPTPVICLSF